MSARRVISIVTLGFIFIILYFSRHEIVTAWNLLWTVDLKILALIIPLQALSYYAAGAMMFTYLKQKRGIKASSIDMMKMSLELNFVNHILPTGGVSGASYMMWRLKKFGVGAGRATLAQAVRFVATFAAFLVLLIIALVMITFDGDINRITILVTSGIASLIVFGTLFIIYIIGNNTRLQSFSLLLTRAVNGLGSRVMRRRTELLKTDKVVHVFAELHEDYLVLRREPRLLIKPLLWGFVYNIAEVAMFAVAFWALGSPVNPAPLLIAFGVATMVGFFVVTPGGAGGYELVMIAFLTSAGINQGVSVAAVVLARTLLIVGTLVSGSVFYYMALGKYGKRTA